MRPRARACGCVRRSRRPMRRIASADASRVPFEFNPDFTSTGDQELFMTVLLTWVVNALALLIITYLVPSIHIRSFGTALIVALVLGLINAVLRPVLILLTLPVTIVTLGLFILVVNA